MCIRDSQSTAGVKLGGDDFDAEIMWARIVAYFGYGALYESYGKWLPVPPNIFRTICSWDKMSVLKRADIQQALKTYQFFSDNKPAMARLHALIDRNLAFAVIKAVERAKIAATDAERAIIRFSDRDIVIEELRRHDGVRYRIDAYVIMPNHIHALIGLKNTQGVSINSR